MTGDTDRTVRVVSRREWMKGAGTLALATVGSQAVARRVAAQSGGPSDEISGVVEDSSGPVQGATVAAVPHDESLAILETTTAADGTYRFAAADLHSNTHLYHVIARAGTETDPRRGQQNYPFISATGSGAPASGISRWKWEQDFVDAWGTHDGSFTGGGQYTTTAKVGTYARAYDGVDDYGAVPHDSALNPGSGSYSWGFWWYPRDLSVDNCVLSKSPNSSPYNGYRSYYFSGFGLNMTVADDNGNQNDPLIPESAISTNAWNHVVCTYDASTSEAIAYLDANSQEADSSTSLGSITPSKDLYFGQRGDGSFYADMIMDDPRLYSKALSASEVSNWYNTGSIS